MKKILLQCLLTLIPFALSAQTEPALFPDFGKSVKNVTTAVKINDHLNVFQINIDNENFNMIAVDDHMKVLWNTSLKGYAMAAGKFKNKVIAVATTDRSGMTGHNSTYKAFALDAATGKLVTEKVVYEGDDKYFEMPSFHFTESGAYFKMVIKQSALERRLHVGIPGLAFLAANKMENQAYAVRDLTAIDLNEQLETISTTKPALSADSKFIAAQYSLNGDLLIAWFKGEYSVLICKYEVGKKDPVSQVMQGYNIRENVSSTTIAEHIKFCTSASDNNIAYSAFMYENTQKDVQLTVTRYDMAKKTRQLNEEIFDKDHIKTLEKAFVKPNKDFDGADLGYNKDLEVRYLEEAGGRLLAGISGRSAQRSSVNSAGLWCNETSILINGYDLNLKPQFQQLLPVQYAYPNTYLSTGYYAKNNILHVIGNFKDGGSIKPIHGTLDMASGKWSQMVFLSKKEMDKADHADGLNAAWFGNSYILPYISLKGLMKNKCDITLQQNTL